MSVLGKFSYRTAIPLGDTWQNKKSCLGWQLSSVLYLIKHKTVSPAKDYGENYKSKASSGSLFSH